MLRRRFIQIVSASAGAAYQGCGGAARNGDLIPLVASSLPRVSQGPLHLAHELGYFADAGLDVSLRQLRFSHQVTPLLAGGQLDVSCLGLNPGFFNIVAKGAQLRLVLCRGVFSQQCALFGTIFGNRKVFPDGLHDLTLLRGKRVSIRGKGNNSEFYLDILLETAGMSSSDVRLVPLPEPEGVAALLSGRIDAMISSDMDMRMETISSDIVQGIGVADVLPGFQYAFVGFGPSIVEGDPEIGIRFLTAYLRGAKDFVAGKTPKFLNDLAEQTRMDPALVRAACREMYVPEGDVDPRSLEIYRDWSVRKGYSPPETAIANLVAASYLEEARKRLGWKAGAAETSRPAEGRPGLPVA